MKKFLKNVTEIALVVCMIFSSTACSKQEMSNATPEEVIKAAVQKMEQVDKFLSLDIMSRRKWRK